VFWEGVHHRARICLDHFSCVKMAVLQFYLQSGKQKSRVGGWGWQSCCSWSNILLWKKKCETVSCRDVTACSFVVKVWEKSSHILKQSP
jgi:hypothetical protein